MLDYVLLGFKIQSINNQLLSLISFNTKVTYTKTTAPTGCGGGDHSPSIEDEGSPFMYTKPLCLKGSHKSYLSRCTVTLVDVQVP